MESNERQGVIYCIKNTSNNKVYIGQTLLFEHRIKTHKLRVKAGLNTHSFYEEMRTNPEIWEISILMSNVPQSELNDKEKYFIKLYDSFRNGYNQTIGGGCFSGHVKFSEERNKKISESMKGENHPNFGKHRVYTDPNNKSAGYHYE